MSRFNVDRAFDPSQPVYCRRPFIANGRRYKPGDVLDWRKLSIAQRKVQIMLEGGFVEHKTSAEVTVEDKTDTIEVKVEPEIIVEDNDGLDAIEDMKELRRIADDVGAPYKVSKADQRQAIRDHRNKESD